MIREINTNLWQDLFYFSPPAQLIISSSVRNLMSHRVHFLITFSVFFFVYLCTYDQGFWVQDFSFQWSVIKWCYGLSGYRPFRPSINTSSSQREHTAAESPLLRRDPCGWRPSRWRHETQFLRSRKHTKLLKYIYMYALTHSWKTHHPLKCLCNQSRRAEVSEEVVLPVTLGHDGACWEWTEHEMRDERGNNLPRLLLPRGWTSSEPGLLLSAFLSPSFLHFLSLLLKAPFLKEPRSLQVTALWPSLADWWRTCCPSSYNI